MEKIEEKFDAVLKEKDGDIKLAAAMQNPIRLRMDHCSIGRRLLLVDPISPKTKVAKYEVDGKHVIIPKFEIESNIVVGRKLWYKIVELVCKGLEERELRSVVSLFACAVKESKQRLVGILNRKSLLKALRLVEVNDLKVGFILMNPKTFAKLLKVRTLRDSIDIITSEEILVTGNVGMLWGMNILVSRVVPVGRVYFSSEPEFVGVMPLYEDPIVFMKQEKGKLRVIVQEQVGMGVLNVRGVSVLVIKN